MGKFKSWKYHNLFTSVATSTCLVGATAGLIFGVSAGTFKVEYMDLESADARLSAAQGTYNYYSQNIGSEWNMSPVLDSHDMNITDHYWNSMHNNAQPLNKDKDGNVYNLGSAGSLTEEQIRNRYDYMSMVIDGSTHSTMDRSFNQGLYNGIVNFIKGKQVDKVDPETENDPVAKNCAHSFKPGADNTTEFLNIYAAVSKQFRTIGLAGFNHVSYLEAMGKRNEETGLFDFSNNDFWKTAYLLIDGNIEKNQNVASVLFRSDQPGWMAGMATCMYFLNNLNLYHDNYQDLALGAYGGTAIPTVMIYLGGVQRGVEFFNNFILKNQIINKEFSSWVKSTTDEQRKHLEEIYDMSTVKSMIEHSKYKQEINDLIADYQGKPTETEKLDERLVDLQNKFFQEYKINIIKLGGGPTHFSGSFASGDAIGITKQFLNRGAGAIIAVAGPQSLDSAQEIKNQQSKCIVIGVDSAMEEGDYQRSQSTADYTDSTVAYGDGSTPANANNIIKFSAIKDITNVTSKFAELCAQNKNFDKVAVHKWEHITPLEKVAVSTASEELKGEIEKKVIPNDNFIIENGVLLGMKSDKELKERSEYTICRIPEEVNTIAEGAFKECFSNADNNGVTYPGVNRIVFNSKNVFKICSNAFETCPNITLLDFSNVKGLIKVQDPQDPQENTFIVEPNSLSGISDSGNRKNIGGIYLNDYATAFGSDDKDAFVSDLALHSGLYNEWYQVNPDVLKSVCNIGYKTCGNIENGLISISWDGWQPFIQAFQHLDISDDGEESTSRYSNFMKQWEFALNGYITEQTAFALETEMGKDDFNAWKEAMLSINKLLTYKTDSIIKKYYPHTIRTLGYFLKNVSLNFDRNQTVIRDAYSRIYLLDEGKTAKMSILDWLRMNMYFTC